MWTYKNIQNRNIQNTHIYSSSLSVENRRRRTFLRGPWTSWRSPKFAPFTDSFAFSTRRSVRPPNRSLTFLKYFEMICSISFCVAAGNRCIVDSETRKCNKHKHSFSIHANVGPRIQWPIFVILKKEAEPDETRPWLFRLLKSQDI